MKKIILSVLVALIMFSASAQAAIVNTKSQRLKNSTGTAITDLAIANAATVYTQAYPVQDNVGFISVLAVEDKAGGAGSVGISAEYSIDGTNFYTVYTTSAGTLTAEAAVVTTLANQTRWIQHTARLAKYVRYKIVAGADSEVTMDIIYQEDR